MYFRGYLEAGQQESLGLKRDFELSNVELTT